MKISVVVPCFNEAENIAELCERLDKIRCVLTEYQLEVICVDDGSRDGTSSALYELAGRFAWLYPVELTRNFGKEAAMTAGLDSASGDAVIVMDADLQHPPEAIVQFVNAWRRGAKVVLGVRSSRNSDSFFYRGLAEAFYRIHNSISEVKLPIGVGDFRLMDASVVHQLRQMRETRRFMKGLFAWVGYEPTLVTYELPPRRRGRSSFNKWKAWNFALEGITSFSSVPLRLWSYVGLAVAVVGVVYAGLIIIKALAYGVETPGYVTLLTAVVVLGGVQLLGIGVLGEYIGRIYFEVKRRPVYFKKEGRAPDVEDSRN